MQHEPNRQHVFITGASSGIGEAIAREYARRGAALTLVARRRNLLEALAADVGVETRVVEADLSDVASVCAHVDSAIEQFGPIDVLVNNAGVQIIARAEATDWDRAEALMRLDLIAPLRITHHALPAMLARGRGTIVNISSMAALAPTPGMFFYNAAKGGLAAASEGLRSEVISRGVNVVTVYPGPVRSAMEVAGRAAFESTRVLSLTPTGDASVLAEMISEAVDQRRARVIYPRVYGLSRHFPNVTRWLLEKITPPLRELPPTAEK
jgi:short-subunit dehydrogenase